MCPKSNFAKRSNSHGPSLYVKRGCACSALFCLGWFSWKRVPRSSSSSYDNSRQACNAVLLFWFWASWNLTRFWGFEPNQNLLLNYFDLGFLKFNWVLGSHYLFSLISLSSATLQATKILVDNYDHKSQNEQTQTNLKKALDWEQSFVKFMHNYQKDNNVSHLFDLAFNSERSIEDELGYIHDN